MWKMRINGREMWKDFIRFGDLLEPGREKKRKEVSIKGMKIMAD